MFAQTLCPSPFSATRLRWRCLRGAGVLALVMGLSACQTLPGSSGQDLDGAAPTGPARATVPFGQEATPVPDNMAAAPQDLYQRIRQGLRIEPLRGLAAVRQKQEQERLQLRMQGLQVIFQRARPYLFDIVQAVERERMPLEIALLPAIESAFLPGARSWAAAEGLWQFIAPTAERYAVQMHRFQDDRRNVREATRAALSYLQFLARRYGGDYQLALAAYNTGEGNVDKAIARAKAAGLPGRYEDLRLAQETLLYVPRLMALVDLLRARGDAGDMAREGWPRLANRPEFVGVPLKRDIDVALAAQLAGMSLAEFRLLNPSHKKPVIAAAANTELLIPVERAEAFRQALSRHPGPLATWGVARVAQRVAPEALASQYGTTADQLRQVNNIPRHHVVTPGSTVLVPRLPGAADIPAQAMHARLLTQPGLVRVKVTARAKPKMPPKLIRTASGQPGKKPGRAAQTVALTTRQGRKV